MTVRRSWPIAVFIAALLAYFWYDEDEVAPVDEPAGNDLVKTPVKVPGGTIPQPRVWNGGADYPPPSQPSGDYASGTDYSGGYRTMHPPQTGRYSFRPLDDKSQGTQGYQTRYPPAPRGPDYSYAMPVPEARQSPGQTPLLQPDDVIYRFRPLDEKRQSKRWRGNYDRKPLPPSQLVRPYPSGRYPAPSNPPARAVGNNPLWANSWPERQ